MQSGVSRDDQLVHIVREPAGDAEGALVLLHGRATSEADLQPLLDALDPDRRLLGITPGGPLTGLPPGGRHWYVIERIGQPDEETFLGSLHQLSGLVDSILQERGIAWQDTVIGGFSQGGAVSLALALGAGRPRAAGILAMSCFLPVVPGWPLEIDAKRGMHAYLTHGTYDDVIPVDFGHRARELLEAGGLRVDFRERPVQHQIDPGLLPEMQAWVLARTGGAAGGPA